VYSRSLRYHDDVVTLLLEERKRMMTSSLVAPLLQRLLFLGRRLEFVPKVDKLGCGGSATIERGGSHLGFG
jgi:hypothetical protein